MRSRIILVPFPAQGHVTAILQLACVLHARGFEVTVATPDFIHRRLVARASSAADEEEKEEEDGGWNILYASLPSGLPAEDTTTDFAAISRAMETHMPAYLERLILSSPCPAGGPVACVVVDLLASWAIPVAKGCGVPVVGFWPAMMAIYRVLSAIPELIQRRVISEQGIPLRHQAHCHENSREQIAEDELILEGQPKLSAEDLPWLTGNLATQKERFAFWLRVLDRAKSLRWLLVNSFPEEGGHSDDASPLPESSGHGSSAPRTLPIGPLTVHEHCRRISRSLEFDPRCRASLWEEDESCLEWLEQQPPESVLYVSFGSWVAPISPEEIHEFALGLEAAGVPFLWALKDEKPWRAGLPAGFADRVASRGGGRLVAWAPQNRVLKSPAVGCFLTHCGWNSTLEAIQHEKRLLCYPISGDQFTNATYIVRVWGAGMRLEGSDRRAVEDGVRGIMRGEAAAKVREGVARLKRRVMGEEGRSKAMANLQCFIDAVDSKSNKF